MSDSKVSDVFIKLNPIIKWILNSRFHSMLSHQLFLMRFEGRKSGKEFTTPVAYTRNNGAFLIGLAEIKTRVWWKNFKTEWPMKAKYKGHWLSGKAELLTIDHQDFRSEWETKLKEKHMDKIFKTQLASDGKITDEQLNDLNQRCGLVRLILDQ